MGSNLIYEAKYNQEQYARHIEYYKELLGKEIKPFEFPLDHKRNHQQLFIEGQVTINLPEALSKQLIDFCKNSDIAIYIAMLTVFKVLLFKYTGADEIVIAFPLLYHEDWEESMNHTLFLRDTQAYDVSFKELLIRTKEQTLNAYKFQDYPLELAFKKAGLDKNDYSFLENIIFHMDNICREFKSSGHDFLFSFSKTPSGISGSVSFNQCILRKEKVQWIIEKYLELLGLFLKNTETKVQEADLLSEQDIHHLVYELNDTDAAYPKEKTIHEIFEEQVFKDPQRVAVAMEGEQLTYDELNRKADKIAYSLRDNGVGRDSIVGILAERSIEMIVAILGVLKAGGAYLPIDPEYPRDRIEFMLQDSQAGILLTQGAVDKELEYRGQKVYIEEILKRDINRETIENINNPEDIAYVIYTSGTTGKPKGAMIEHKNVVRLMINSRMPYDFHEDDVWTTFHSFCFDFSVWEMYGALLYGGKLIIVPKRVAQDAYAFSEMLKNEKVTVLNQTPAAFYNLSNVEINKKEAELSLRYVIFGGEALRTNRLKEWKEKYPGTTLVNMYGITETTVHVTYKEIGKDEIEANISNIGRPIPTLTTYIMDTDMKLVPAGSVGELYVGGEGVCRGYLNRPKLNRARFVENPYRKGERLYRSGDLARLLWNGEMEYVGRIDRQVKIRGHRVEIAEIESVLLKYEGVNDGVVVDKEETDGTISLRAYFTAERDLTVLELKNYLLNELPAYMIPSFFYKVESIPLTSNGKVDRKLLEKNAEMVKDHTVFELPSNETEARILEIWKETLEIESISINDNFFEIGGHSLKAALIAVKMHKEFEVEVPMLEIFNHPTIKSFAGYIENSNQKGFVSILPVEKQEVYPVSSTQKRLLVLEKMLDNGIAYNVPYVFTIEGDLEIGRLEHAFRKLIQKNEILRTSFDVMDVTPVQKVHEEVNFALEFYRSEENNIDTVIAGFVKPFTLSEAPLLRVAVIGLAEQRYILVVDMHHIITDAPSLDIMMKELSIFYEGGDIEEKPLQYKDYSVWQNQLLDSDTYKKQEEYWLDVFSGEIPVLNMPIDYKRPMVQSFDGDAVGFKADRELTGLLNQLAISSGATLYMVLLVALNILLSKYTGQEDIIIGTPVEGRRHADLQNVMGMFVNTLAIRSYPQGNKAFMEFLKDVKINTIKAFENQEYQFEELIEKIDVARDFSRNPLFDVMLAMIKSDAKEESSGTRLLIKPYPSGINVAKFDLTFIAADFNGEIEFRLEYCTKLFKRETAEQLAESYLRVLKCVVVHYGKKLHEIDLLSGQEKMHILYELNDTSFTYEKYKTVCGLFEEQVERTPDDIAVVYRENRLTYRELNKRANQLSRVLIKKGVGPECIVALLMERSEELVIGVLAVIKAGGAYLSIDPGYPKQRIISILQDSKAKVIITREQHVLCFPFHELTNLLAEEKEPTTPCKRDQILDVDSLPIPDRTLVDYEKYHQYIGLGMATSSITIQATRGCPYDCAFCHKIWPKKHVTRSAEHIFKEIELYYTIGIRKFVFIDDIFNLDAKNSSRLFHKIIDAGMKIQLYFPNGLRGDILTLEYIDLMVKAGTVNISLALETASERLQKLIGKNLNLKNLKENMEYITSEYPGVILELETMIGFPTETEEEARMTLDFIKNIQWIHFPYIHVLKIYPNTDMARIAMENGVSPEAIQNSLDLAYHEVPETLPFPKLFAEEYQAEFLKNYFLSKERLLKVLPQQMKVATESELIQKYNSYLPVSIQNFSELLNFLGISKSELPEQGFLDSAYGMVRDFNAKLRQCFVHKEADENAYKILLLDLSQPFSKDAMNVYDVIEPPLGLMYLMTYLKEKFGSRIQGRIMKSRIDFDSFEELLRHIDEYKPDLVGIRTLTIFKEFFHQSVSVIKHYRSDLPIIAGGPYATSDYATLLKDHNVDLAVLGEGEHTFHELIERILENGGKLPLHHALSQIPGISIMADEKQPEDCQKRREVVLLDHAGYMTARESGDNPVTTSTPQNLLYVIYTSGSTGIPKGVMIENKNMVNLIQYQYACTSIDFSDKVLQFASSSFDVCYQEIFSTLLAGGELYILDEESKKQVNQLFEFIWKENIHILFLPTSYLKFIFTEYEFSFPVPKSLKHIITAGEQLVIGDRLKAFLRENRIWIHNHYGPSETHVVTTLTMGPTEDIPTLPAIGSPIGNTRILVLDARRKLVPVNIPGEIYISGESVGRGYLERPELTAERFMQNPFVEGERMYRTGDLGRWLPDGNIEFLGRIDHQVKIRGYRIELGEIESMFLKQESIREVVVIPRETGQGSQYLCAYFSAEVELPVGELKANLLRVLPDYMVPSYFIQVDQIPLTANGKVDRNLLPEPGKVMNKQEEYSAPMTQTEEKLVLLWKDILHMDHVNIHDNFFDMGGHSLKATILVSKVLKEFNVEMSIGEVFKKNTVKEQAEYIDGLKQVAFSSIPQVEKQEFYPVSAAQKRLYLLNQFAGAGIAYNMPGVFIMEGEMDPEKFKKSVKSTVQRHEALRTSFHVIDGQILQQVHDEVEFDIPYVETSALEAEALIDQFIRPFEMETAPLLRVLLVKVSDNRHILMYDMHHIISDGTSMGIFVNEAVKSYEGIKLPELRVHYKDFSAWQNEWIVNGRMKEQEEYWLCKLKDEIPVLDMPLDYTRPAVQSFEGDHIIREIDIGTLKKVKHLVAEEGTTLFIALLAGYTALLYRYTGQEDVIVGTPIAGRRHADLEPVIGMFSNTLAMRNYPQGNKSFREYLREVSRNALQDYENQDCQFDELVEKLHLKRDLGRNPLFDTMLVLQNTGNDSLKMKSLKVMPYDFQFKISKFDFMVNVVETQTGLALGLEYCTALFRKESMERFLEHFVHLLESAVQNPDIKLAQINILSEDEKHTILSGFNDTGTACEEGETIHGLFRKRVERNPQYIALVHEGCRMTYGDLDQKSEALAVMLKAKGVERNSIVGIMVERSFEMIIGIFAVLKAGGCFVPIDESYPLDRKQYMLQNSGAKVLLVDREIHEMMFDKVVLNVSRPEIYQDVPKRLENVNTPEDLLYIIYTSGTTGTPKGAMLEHRNMVNLIQYEYQKTAISFERVLQFTTMSFDVSYQEIFSTLLAGGQLFLIKDEERKDPLLLLEYIRNYEIGTLFLPTSFAKFLMNENEYIRQMPSCIRHIIVAGEQLVVVDSFKEYLEQTGVMLHNHYGPSETHVVTAYTMERTDQMKEIPPIGKPIHNTFIYILNESMELQPVGVPGELYVSGDSVGRGYIGNPELTNKKFTADPFRKEKRMYRTGDRARWLPDGNIEFLGRLDHQVKIRGYRIELGEVESRLLEHPRVKEAAVIDRYDASHNKYLSAYVSTESDLSVMLLKEWLSERLPGYMIPSYLMILDHIPLTPNGKIDRKALPDPVGNIVTGVVYEAPENEIEKKLVQIWMEIFELQKVGVHDNFFELGGHSLKAITLISKIHKTFNTEIPLRDIFSAQTVRELSKKISEAKESIYISIQPAGKKEYYPVSAAQKRMYIIHQMESSSISYNMPGALIIEGNLDRERFSKTLRMLVKRHESLRTSFTLQEGEPVQKIHEDVDFKIAFLQGEENNAEQLVNSFIRPFKLSEAPLLRVGLIELQVCKYILIFDMHHIISDGISMGILVREFITLYDGGALPALRIQYKDFSEWQNKIFSSQIIRNQEDYWMNVFSGEIPLLNMPLDYKRPDIQTFHGGTIQFHISRKTAEKMEELAKKLHTTLNVIWFSVYGLLISKYSGQEDMIIGSTVAGRQHGDLENIIGMFANFLPVRLRINSSHTFLELLHTVKDLTLAAYENQSYPFEELVSKLAGIIDRSRNPLFDTMLIFHNELEQRDQQEVKGLKFYPFEMERKTSKLDFKLDIFTEENNGFLCVMEYNTALFTQETIRGFSDHFIRLADDLVQNPEGQLTDVNLFSEDEKVIIKEKKENNRVGSDAGFQLAVAATFTAEPVENYITWWCKQFGETVKVSFAPYHQVFQELLNPLSLLSTNRRANLILVRFEDWIRDDPSEVEIKLEKLERNFKEFMELLQHKDKAVPYFAGVFPVSNHLALQPEIIEKLKELKNRWKLFIKGLTNVYGIDFDEMSDSYDIETVFDSQRDQAGHMPFTDEFYAVMGTGIARKLCALKRQPFKVIVLDCDNTLWKGVCAEDGALGVKIEKPFLDFQRLLIQKQDEGMLLALCSKNNEADVWEVFDKNHEMLLKKEHFAAWRINWQAKSVNIREIAAELNVGSDSFIFFDDSDMECAEVMTHCPEVLTLKLPEDQEQIPSFIGHIWALDKLNTTEEDQKRTAMYLAERKRQQEKSVVPTLEDFLKGLELAMSMNVIENDQMERIAQLTQRTNQFNISTIRRSVKEIESLSKVPGMVCRVIEVKDRFGDYGIVGAVITQENTNTLFLESFMLSCRVLGRGVEDAVLVGLVKYCRDKNIPVIQTRYYPTHKNIPVLEFFHRTQWEKGDETDEWTEFCLHTGEWECPVDYIDCYFDMSYEKQEDLPKTKHTILLDHIAIAVSDMERQRSFYRAIGYTCGEVVYDPLQNSNLLMCNAQDYDSIELVAPINSESPSYSILERGGNTPYHLCYRVKDFDLFFKELEHLGLAYELITEAKPAVLFQHKEVLFVFIKTVGLIELLKEGSLHQNTDVKQSTVSIIVPEMEKPVMFFKYLGYTEAKTVKNPLRRLMIVTLEKQGCGKVELMIPIENNEKEYLLLQSKGPHIDKIIYTCKEMERLLQDLAGIDSGHWGIDSDEIHDKECNGQKPLMINYHEFHQRQEKHKEKHKPFWEVHKTNEENLLHKSFLLPLIHYSAAELLKLPVYDIKKAKMVKVAYEAPHSELEKHLVGLWEKVLKIEPVGIRHNFFELGGNSLIGIKLVVEIHRELHIEIQLRDIFTAPTVKELAQRIKGATESAYSFIQPVEKKEYYMASAAQKRQYAIHMLDRESTAYNMPMFIMIEGSIDKEKFENSMKALIKRHEALRTSFEMCGEEPVQRIHDSVDFEIVCGVSCRDIEEEVKGFVKPFNLSKAPLMRAKLIKVSEEKHMMMLDMHHIISDGVSMGIFTTDLISLYTGQDLPDLNLHYKDYAAWQNNLFMSEGFKIQENFWMETFSDEIPILNLPLDFPRPPMRSSEGDTVDFIAEEELTFLIDQLCRKYGVTTYMVLLAAYNILLSKYSGQEDIVVGTPVAGRQHSDLEHMIGMFVNTLAMRNKPNKNKRVKDFLMEVRDEALKAFENQEYQFETLIEKLQVQRDLSRNPLFDTMFVLQNMDIPRTGVDGLQIQPVKFENRTSRFDIVLNAVETENRIGLTFEYCSKVFEKSTLKRMGIHFLRILETIAKDPEILLSKIGMMTDEEERQLTEASKDMYSMDWEKNQTIIDLFEEQVEKTPDHVAIVFGESTLTYRELNMKANSLARVLGQRGVSEGRVVALMADRSIEMIIGIMAILKSGGAYLPVSPEYPLERIEFMLKDSNAWIILVQTGFEGLKDRSEKVVDLLSHELYEGDGSNLHHTISDNDLAYIIYTSGTTGTPKGVMIEHQSFAKTIRWRKEEYQYSSEDIILQLFSYVFDGFVTSFFTPLVSGSKVVLLGEEESKDATAIKKKIVEHHVTSFISIPMLFNFIMDSMTGQEASSLRVVTLAGDKVDLGILKLAKQKNPYLEIVNEYGPTESTVVATIARHVENEDIVTIGKPVIDTSIFILDDMGRMQPIGVPGEISIAGGRLARGYVNMPELTVEKFVPSPYRKDQKMYKTGDMGRRLSNGNIEFLGRVDHQVKIRGYRIELTEIKNVLLTVEGMKETFVLVHEDKLGDKYLCAYFLADKELSVVDLRSHLLKFLPDYMVPSCFAQLEKIPVTPSGKVDWRALPKPERRYEEEEYVAPRNEYEEKLCILWQCVLEADRIGIHDNFFDRGGDSFKALRIVNEAVKQGIQIEVSDVFRLRNIAKISEKYDFKVMNENQSSEVNSEDHDKVVMVKDFWGVEDIYTVDSPEEKELKINVQNDINVYNHRALPLCVVLADSNLYSWYYEHFINVFSYTDIEGHLNFDFLEPWDLYRSVIKEIALGSKMLEREADIISYIEERIEQGYYVNLSVDEYYFPGKEKYLKVHYIHFALIYAYDKVKRTFKTVGYDKDGFFTSVSISYKELMEAYEKGKMYYEVSAPWTFVNAVQLFSSNDFRKPYPFNMRRFLNELGNYLHSTGEDSILYYWKYYDGQIRYGISIYDSIVENLQEILKGNFVNGLDYRVFHLIYEQKKSVLLRLRYIISLYPDTNQMPQIMKHISEYEKVAEGFNTLRLKVFQMQKDMEMGENPAGLLDQVKWIITEIPELRDLEFTVLSQVFDVLNTLK